MAPCVELLSETLAKAWPTGDKNIANGSMFHPTKLVNPGSVAQSKTCHSAEQGSVYPVQVSDTTCSKRWLMSLELCRGLRHVKKHFPSRNKETFTVLRTSYQTFYPKMDETSCDNRVDFQHVLVCRPQLPDGMLPRVFTPPVSRRLVFLFLLFLLLPSP